MLLPLRSVTLVLGMREAVMCECLSYEDGSEYLCEACGPRWREYEASLSRPPADAATEAYAAFGRALLPLWWDDGNPGDIDGGDVQDAAEKAGLWHHVERHAEGVECDWCNNEEPCGELTEAGLSALSTPAPAPSAKEGRT